MTMQALIEPTGLFSLLVKSTTQSWAMGALRPVDGETCEIVRMRVNPDWQGRVYGRAILDALERQAIDLGYRRAVLLTGPEQHPAIDLYTKFGYQLVAVENHGELSGIRLAKDLRLPLANNLGQ